MTEDFDENVVSIFQRILPVISSLMIMLISYVPLGLPIFNNIRPDLGFACIYFWMLHRPDIFGVTSVLILGLLDMVLSSALAGSEVFAYLVMYVLVYNTQKFFNSKSFVVIWYGYIALFFIALITQWLVVSVYYRQFLPLSILMFCYFIGVAIYPLVSVVLAYLQNKFIQDDGL